MDHREQIAFCRSRLDPISGDQVELRILRARVTELEGAIRAFFDVPLGASINTALRLQDAAIDRLAEMQRRRVRSNPAEDPAIPTAEELIALGFRTNLREYDAECDLLDQYRAALAGEKGEGT